MSATRPPAFDDRFSTPIEASRRGAHRARPKPVSAGLPVIAGAGVILLVLGGGYVVFKGGNSVSEGSSNRAAAGAVDDDSGPTSTATKKASAPAADTGTKNNSGGGSGKADAPKADKSIPLTVLNSGTIKGLAARKGDALAADGWTIERTGNPQAGDKGLATSKIYYGSSATKETATALQKELGYGNLVRNSAVAGSNKIVVVLGRDAE